MCPESKENNWNRFNKWKDNNYDLAKGKVPRTFSELDNEILDSGNWRMKYKGTGKHGNRPPNLSPKGAGRNGAFREAKRKMGIPVSGQPKEVRNNVDKRGNKSSGKQYDFGNGKVIRDDSNGHIFLDDPTQNRGPHFNDPDGNHYDY